MAAPTMSVKRDGVPPQLRQPARGGHHGPLPVLDLALQVLHTPPDRLRVLIPTLVGGCGRVVVHLREPPLVLLLLLHEVLELGLARPPCRPQGQEEETAGERRDDHHAQPQHQKVVLGHQRDGPVGGQVRLVEAQPQDRAADHVQQPDGAGDHRREGRRLGDRPLDHACEPARRAGRGHRRGRHRSLAQAGRRESTFAFLARAYVWAHPIVKAA
jgi:hypothetical protein